MRFVGFIFSVLIHACIVFVGTWAFVSSVDMLDEEFIIVPIELVTIDETTNLRAPEPEPVPEEEEPPQEEAPEPEPEPEPEPPPPEDEPNDVVDELGEEEETTDAPEPEPEPEPVAPETSEQPLEEDTPEPEPQPDQVTPEKPSVDRSFLDSILQTAEEKREERIADREEQRAADLKRIEDANRSMRSAGDRARDTATWNAMLISKLNGCWRDPSDMANAERLKVSYRIMFNRDGNLQLPPRRISPRQISQSDQQMFVFDINAVRAIEKCAPYDDIFPPEHYEEWKEFTFNFGKALE